MQIFNFVFFLFWDYAFTNYTYTYKHPYAFLSSILHWEGPLLLRSDVSGEDPSLILKPKAIDSLKNPWCSKILTTQDSFLFTIRNQNMIVLSNMK